ncbi:hypothetical protein Hanom_Chr07g00650991 [Helianthus anomalus]
MFLVLLNSWINIKPSGRMSRAVYTLASRCVRGLTGSTPSKALSGKNLCHLTDGVIVETSTTHGET